MTFELVKIFNQPIVEVQNGTMMNENFKFVVKIETTQPLDHPLTFTFTYTDGRYDELLKSVNLNAPQPKKIRFTADVPAPDCKKAPLYSMLAGSAVLIDVIYNGQILTRIPVHCVVEDVKGELKLPETVEEEEFEPEEEEQHETDEQMSQGDRQAIEEAFGGEEEDYDASLYNMIKEMAQRKLDEALKKEAEEKQDTQKIPQFATPELFARLKRDLVVLRNSVTDGVIKRETKTIDE